MIGPGTAFDLFQSEFADPELDRTRLLRHFREYARTGEVVEPPKLDSGRWRMKLVSGRWQLDGGRTLLGQYSWKWSEVSGKYLGCPYWSVAAASSIETVIKAFPRMSPRGLGKETSKRERGGSQLQHEHVFPREDWDLLMSPRIGRGVEFDEAEVREWLDRYCIGCVVTRAENAEVSTRRANRDNPWLRYCATSIRLVENPAWSEWHRRSIREAGLV